MKRVIIIAAVLLGALVLVPALAFASGTKEGNAASTAQTTIVIWGGVPIQNGPQEYVDFWNKNHKNVKISYVRYVNDQTGNTKLDTALLSGEKIDLYYSYGVPNLVQRISAGFAENLSKFDAKQFIQKTMGLDGVFSYKGEYYSIPTTREMDYLMVNKTMFDKLGIAVPRQWTIPQFRDIAKKLATLTNPAGKKVYAIDRPLDFARVALGPNYWYKNGGKSANFTNPAFAESYKVNYEMMFVDKSMFPWRQILALKAQAYSQNLFLNETVAMISSAPWQLRYVDNVKQYPHNFVTSFAPMPTVPGTPNYNPGALNNWLLINSKSPDPQEAWNVMKYIVQEGSRYMLKGGKIPLWSGIDQNQTVAGLLGPDANKLFDVAAFKDVALNPNIKLGGLDTITVAAPEINQIVNEENDKYFLGQESVSELINRLQTRADKAITSAGQ